MFRKYKNVKTVVDGISFDSKKESLRYVELKFFQRAGEISDLKLQVRFDIIVNKKKICFYKADFTYTKKDGAYVVEDVKGVKTATYRLKKKLLKAIYDIDIYET